MAIPIRHESRAAAVRTKPCNKCTAPIRFVRASGVWKPVNADGSPHSCGESLEQMTRDFLSGAIRRKR